MEKDKKLQCLLQFLPSVVVTALSSPHETHANLHIAVIVLANFFPRHTSQTYGWGQTARSESQAMLFGWIVQYFKQGQVSSRVCTWSREKYKLYPALNNPHEGPKHCLCRYS